MKISFPEALSSRFFSKINLSGTTNKKNISSSFRWGKYFFLLSLASLVVFSNGCKDPDELGLNVLPASDSLGTSYCDTLTVWTKTVREDSLRTDELTVQLLGSINDPVFGRHQASIYTHAVLSGIPSFGGITEADSLVLVLAYSGFYGDTTGQRTVNVYQMTEDMYFDSIYYSNQTFAYNPSPVASMNFTPHPYRSVVVGNDTLPAQLRIPLSLTMANDILAHGGLPELSTADNWNAYFKGLYIQTDAAGNCISYFNFYNSHLTLYYHGTDSVAKTYAFSLAGGRVNSFFHNYSGTPVSQQLIDSSAVDSLAFLQGMAGLKVKISMPFLKHFVDSGSIVVNKAELDITTQATSSLMYSPPTKLLLVALDSTGSVNFPIDYYETAGYFGGDLNTSGNTYSFNLARQVQRILDGRTSNYGFYLVVSGSSVSANRLIIGSGKNQSYPVKMKIYYTRLP